VQTHAKVRELCFVPEGYHLVYHGNERGALVLDPHHAWLLPINPDEKQVTFAHAYCFVQNSQSSACEGTEICRASSCEVGDQELQGMFPPHISGIPGIAQSMFPSL
jgi:hypothetical protein